MIVIPAKFGSSRLPEKNFKPFFEGLSLLQIATIRASLTGHEVVVSSERPDIVRDQLHDLPAKIIQDIKIISRDDKLAKDPATILDVLRDTIAKRNSQNLEFIACVLPTSPFNTHTLILKAIETYKKSNCDRLISVCQSTKPPFNSWLLKKSMELEFAFPESPFRSTKSTECPSTYLSNGCIGIYDVNKLCAGSEFTLTHGFEMEDMSSIDIDHDFEFKMASAIFERFSKDAALVEEVKNSKS
tara:strand:- start:1692 stop:2420 length:729 start_codon:yes stop_codon:yes gene_type:complete